MSKKLFDTFTNYNDFGISKVLSDMYKPLKEMQKIASVLNKFNNPFIYNVNMINNNNFVKEMQKITSVSNKFNSINKLLKNSRLNDNSIKEIQKILSAHNINSILPQFSDTFKNLKLIQNNYYRISKSNLFAISDALINDMKLNNTLDGCSEDDIENISNELKNSLIEVNESLINQEKVDISNWQIKLLDKFEKFRKKNPIIIGVIIIIFRIFIEPLIRQSILNIYSKPDNKSTVIYQTNIYQTNITITNNIPYYYYIETKDKNGKIIKGYVSKRKYNKLKSNTNDNSKGNLNK